MTTFSATGFIQYDTITSSGTYAMTVDGAEGGGVEFGSTGGLGASVSGDIYLAAGAVLEIVVGGEGGGGAHRRWRWRRWQLRDRDQ